MGRLDDVTRYSRRVCGYPWQITLVRLLYPLLYTEEGPLGGGLESSLVSHSNRATEVTCERAWCKRRRGQTTTTRYMDLSEVK